VNRSRLLYAIPVLFAVIATAAMVFGPLGVTPAYALVSPQAIPEFTITGSGWGHGIGLSQWGAKGFAEHGMSGEDIATYYHPGTSISTAADKDVWVNLDNNKSSSNEGFTRASWRIRPGYVGGTIEVKDGETVVGVLDDKTWTVAVSGGGLSVTDGVTVYGPLSSVTLTPKGGSPGLIQVIDQSGPFSHTYVRYRGTFQFTVSSAVPGYSKLVNQLAMDDYLYGVVPRESPSYFHPEALKAQALVARSYAWKSSGDSEMTTSELYCNTRSQVYNGHSKGDRTDPQMHEAASTNSAVDATSGCYVTYLSKVIQTFFHSSSGGHTADIEDVWPGTLQPSTTHPYRAGVLSEYEASAGDPNASWTPQTLTGLQIAQKLTNRYPDTFPSGAGVSVWVVGITVDRASSGFVSTMDISWSNGQVTTDLNGDSFRSALALKSTKFTVIGFPMERIQGPTRYETAVEVSGHAFPGTAPVVVIASGEDFADALAGSALAGARSGALLLTARDTLPTATKDEIERLEPAAVYVLGGEAAITEEVFAAVQAAAGLLPIRISGSDRYVTSARVADEVSAYSASTTALVASGSSWPDAAALSALAYSRGYPILLARHGGLPEAAQAFLADNETDKVLVAGGYAALSTEIDAQIVAVTGNNPQRFAGDDRYHTTTKIADYCTSLGFTTDDVYVATGQLYADALTGGVLAGIHSNPLILTQKDECPGSTSAWLAANRAAISELHILGGTAAVSDEGLLSIGSAMTQ